MGNSHYLIAYIARNDRVLSTDIWAESQSIAIKNFQKFNPCCEIIAISLIEE